MPATDCRVDWALEVMSWRFRMGFLKREDQSCYSIKPGFVQGMPHRPVDPDTAVRRRPPGTCPGSSTSMISRGLKENLFAAAIQPIRSKFII